MKSFFVILVLLFLVVVASFFWWRRQLLPVSPGNSAKIAFIIPKGASGQKIADDLAKQGLVKNVLAFRIYIRLKGDQTKLKPGEYLLSQSMGVSSLVAELLAGPKELWVTFPEGLRREEIVAKTIESLNMTGEKANNFLNEFLDLTKNEEGHLFPDSYLFPIDVSAAQVFKKLRSNFDQKLTDQMVNDAKNNGLDINQIVTLASIVERETVTDEERPIVAGILIKRLEAGWPLQTDATLQYIVGSTSCGKKTFPQVLTCQWWRPPTVEDRNIRSFYNSYTHVGLPPAPISNPGISSMHAVTYLKDSPYWFYLHDKEGKIHYAKTVEEHQENINKYLR